jgi:transposase
LNTLDGRPIRKPKTVGNKDADLSGLPVNIIDHYMTDEELIAEFGENDWKQLPDAISKRYRFIPAKVEVDEHHVGVYASKKMDIS